MNQELMLKIIKFINYQ